MPETAQGRFRISFKDASVIEILNNLSRVNRATLVEIAVKEFVSTGPGQNTLDVLYYHSGSAPINTNISPVESDPEEDSGSGVNIDAMMRNF